MLSSLDQKIRYLQVGQKLVCVYPMMESIQNWTEKIEKFRNC